MSVASVTNMRYGRGGQSRSKLNVATLGEYKYRFPGEFAQKFAKSGLPILATVLLVQSE